MSETTRLLRAAGQGDATAAAKLLPVLYDELRKLARAQMAREMPGHTLQATELVHEAYVRLVASQPGQQWDGRRHFFAAAAEAMRRILIDHARRKQAIKRGGARHRVELDDEVAAIVCPCPDTEDLLALNRALDELAREEPEKAELIKLLYFAGLNLEEAAALLGLSRTTAHRQRVFARAWLHNAMTRGSAGRSTQE